MKINLLDIYNQAPQIDGTELNKALELLTKAQRKVFLAFIQIKVLETLPVEGQWVTMYNTILRVTNIYTIDPRSHPDWLAMQEDALGRLYKLHDKRWGLIDANQTN